MARQRVIVTWKRAEKSNLVRDFDSYLAGKMTQTTLRRKYRGRTIGALKNKYNRIRKAGKYTYSPAEVRNGNSLKKIPNFLKGVASRLKAEKLSENQINRVLFGSRASFTAQSIRQLEQLAGTEGSVNVRLFIDTDTDKVRFEEIK